MLFKMYNKLTTEQCNINNYKENHFLISHDLDSPNFYQIFIWKIKFLHSLVSSSKIGRITKKSSRFSNCRHCIYDYLAWLDSLLYCVLLSRMHDAQDIEKIAVQRQARLINSKYCIFNSPSYNRFWIMICHRFNLIPCP